MYAIKPLELSSLDEQTKQAYEALTEPKFRCCLSMQQPNGILFTIMLGIGITYQDVPVGLLLASFFPASGEIEVHSYFIQESHRQKKLGTWLFHMLEQVGKALNVRLLFATYPTNEFYAPYIERIFKNIGWSTPTCNLVHCRLDEKTFHPSWWKRDYEFAPGVSSVLWQEVSQQEKQKIREALAPLNIGYVSPFKDEANIEYLNSLGLRYNGEIIGWMITHRKDPDTIQYSCLYVDPKFQIQGDGIKLLSEALWMQKDAGIRWGFFEVNVEQSPVKWNKFVERRLMPLATSVTFTNISRKAL